MPTTADDDDSLEYALRLALSRCTGSDDSTCEVLAEVHHADACLHCIIGHLLDLLACFVDDDDIALIQGELTNVLDGIEHGA